MTRFNLLMTACAAIALSACSPDHAETLPLPGSDRDAHNCIGSAGYRWSEMLSECIRLFERGIALTDMQDPEGTGNAYLVKSDGGRTLELYDTHGLTYTLSQTATNEWQDKDGLFTIRLEPPRTYAVYNAAGENVYYEDRRQRGAEPDIAADDDVLTEFGILSDIEDSGYPFFSANMTFPERNMVIPFTLNAEALGMAPDEIAALEGQYVTIDYTTDLEKTVYEIELEGDFLMGTKDRAELSDYNTARGLMGGAEITMGDLPGTFYLEDAEGGHVYFEEFIDDDMMKGNGHDVVIYYLSSVQNEIVKITKPDE